MRTGKVNFSHDDEDADRLIMMLYEGQKYYPLIPLYLMLSPYFRPKAIYDVFWRYALIALNNGRYDFISKYGLVGSDELKTPEKPVGIVRDGVSAILMDLMYPKITWLGIDIHSEYNLRLPEVVDILAGRKIILYPYAGEDTYKSEKKLADDLKTKGLHIEADGSLRNLENHLPYRFDIGDMCFSEWNMNFYE
ncbi:MAG: DUF6371 domain-containing protein [Candidatus Symbiothrix sp.]|jgi:hypothetical protein|nr:DUF6371 domain-containing protein [Candidatus Symbiothrix sp.]